MAFYIVMISVSSLMIRSILGSPDFRYLVDDFYSRLVVVDFMLGMIRNLLSVGGRSYCS